MRGGQVINEQVFELVKNMLRVVRTYALLSPELWEVTWKVFNLPELQEEVSPSAEAEAVPA